MKGKNPITGTVHFAKPATRARAAAEGLIQQACGMSRSQYAYLDEVPEGAPVTCKRCEPRDTTPVEAPGAVQTPAEMTPTETVNRLAEVCAGSTPSETLAGRFHQAARNPRDAEGWRRLAEQAEEIARLARDLEHVTR